MVRLTKSSTLRCAITAVGSGVLLAGCASVNPFASADPRWADYKSWTKVSEEPSTGPAQALGAVHMGPNGYRDVFVNDVGREMLLGDGPYDFPAGTVIVKEQYPSEAAWSNGSDPDLTISVKVADSSGTPSADWNWAIGYKGTAKQTIADPNCVACHTAAVALNKSDYMFSVPAYLAAN